jgi:toxin FitB
MFLVDTNAISELRKGSKADPGVVRTLKSIEKDIFIPAQVIGELRQGIEKLRHRGDFLQAQRLEAWVATVLDAFALRVLAFDVNCAQVWGRLMGRSNQSPLDKQIAAIALVYDLTVVTRDTSDFAETGVRLLNPFVTDSPSVKPAN